MKTRLALIAASVALATAPFATAQEASPRVRYVPKPPNRSQPVSGQVIPAPEILSKNVEISLKGTVGDGLPLDISLTGCAAVVTSSFVVGKGEIPTIASIHYIIREASGKYTVSYEIGLRIPIMSGNKVSFQEAMLQNTVHCDPNKTVKIYNSGANSLSITIGEADPE